MKIYHQRGEGTDFKELSDTASVIRSVIWTGARR